MSTSLFDVLNVLQDGLPIPTSYTQLLKSRAGLFARPSDDRLVSRLSSQIEREYGTMLGKNAKRYA